MCHLGTYDLYVVDQILRMLMHSSSYRIFISFRFIALVSFRSNEPNNYLFSLNYSIVNVLIKYGLHNAPKCLQKVLASSTCLQ